MKNKKLIIFLYGTCIINNVYAEEQNIIQKFEALLGRTRLIYNLSDKGAVLNVKNPQNYPILVQSKIYNDDDSVDSDFVISPPIFRLDNNQDTDIQINRIKGNYSEKQESLKKLCVRAIPPKANDLWSKEEDVQKMMMNVSINTCIKLIIRPKHIGGVTNDSAHNITWSVQGTQLFVSNNSPHYITLAGVKINGVNIRSDSLIAPFSKKLYSTINNKNGNISWSIIDDLGAISSEANFKF
ncbi:fimbria/pilus periplasmic chaperone [Escherichia coli]|uniref:fimbria/pilus periplasmic chaperone n=1 Tax=Escherichia coli TaxID=562 RepID=UPI000BE7A144|nr:fimbria/pilus periplasmic chaperone [Escherichia coli]EFD0901626.1 pili assembly chaperone [Escherichia coli]EFJ2451671.1 fimbria/pilus periplasmic chaperone [Escherichia coli]EFK5292325.1 fimbria/pilus periplasmic chaperone [Escherichia coli]EFO0900187.1 pili assembly chaperone [Escherichia coli]MBW9779683.1 fimbria/pilus periplasmic chaperone [Escherichia coli]